MEATSGSGRLVGDYLLQQQIGSGSFADVWKAVHKGTGDIVAIKEIATDKLNRKLRQSLDSEVSILRRISHRNIVQLYTVIEVRPSSSLMGYLLEDSALGQHARLLLATTGRQPVCLSVACTPAFQSLDSFPSLAAGCGKRQHLHLHATNSCSSPPGT